MTETETKKTLAILKAAYPSAIKGMTREDGFVMLHLWQMQFASIPAELVLIAVNSLISKNAFLPSIAEVKAELRKIRDEAEEKLWYNSGGALRLTDGQVAAYRATMQALEIIETEQNNLLSNTPWSKESYLKQIQ